MRSLLLILLLATAALVALCGTSLAKHHHPPPPPPPPPAPHPDWISEPVDPQDPGRPRECPVEVTFREGSRIHGFVMDGGFALHSSAFGDVFVSCTSLSGSVDVQRDDDDLHVTTTFADGDILISKPQDDDFAMDITTASVGPASVKWKRVSTILLLDTVEEAAPSDPVFFDPASATPDERAAWAALVRNNSVPGFRVIREFATYDASWVKPSSQEAASHPEIAMYRIFWEDTVEPSAASQWYVPGEDDMDPENPGLLLWHYFYDHWHEYVQSV